MNYLTVAGKKVLRIGLGTNRIHDDEQSRSALKKAISLGINFIDTAAAYTGGISEQVIGQTLFPYDNMVIAPKGGMLPPDFRVDSRPETLSRQLDESLKKLRVQTIDLYFLHRVDPHVPLKESLVFLKDMQQAGKIKHLGLSEVSVKQIEEARSYIDIAAVENEYNLSSRKHDDVISYCEKENIVFIPFFPLHFQIKDSVMWQQLQEKYHATESQLALAWLLKRSPIILPIPGLVSEKHLTENAAAVDINLTDEDFSLLSASTE